MQLVGKFVIVISIWAIVQCSPFDDGKYKPKNYDYYDDGKYYRPADEGKYIPGDEGKYTYIYQRGVYPYDGTYKHLGRGDSNEYIGHQIYAPRFPFIYRIITAFVTKYVSPDIGGISDVILGRWSANNLEEIQTDEEVALKCKVIEPEPKNISEPLSTTEYPPYEEGEKLSLEGEKLGTFYNFKGSKVLSTISNAKNNKLKLEYEVLVRIVEDVSE